MNKNLKIKFKNITNCVELDYFKLNRNPLRTHLISSASGCREIPPDAANIN